MQKIEKYKPYGGVTVHKLKIKSMERKPYHFILETGEDLYGELIIIHEYNKLRKTNYD